MNTKRQICRVSHTKADGWNEQQISWESLQSDWLKVIKILVGDISTPSLSLNTNTKVSILTTIIINEIVYDFVFVFAHLSTVFGGFFVVVVVDYTHGRQ